MADEPETEADLEVYDEDSQLKLTIEELNQEIDRMVTHAGNSKDDPQIQALFVELKVLKHIQQGLKNKFDDFLTQFCGRNHHPNPHVFKTDNERYKELKEKVEEFKKEEDGVKEAIDKVMVQLGGPENYGDDEPVVKRYWTLEPKIYDDYFDPNKPFNVKKDWESNEGQEVVIGEFEEIEGYLDTKKEMGLEGKIRALSLAREAFLEKDESARKKSLLKWIKDFDEGTSMELVALKGIRDRVFSLGRDVCRMLGVLMFRISRRQKVLAKFHEFKSVLESFSANKNLLVTRKVIESLEITKTEQMMMQLHMKGSFAAGKQKVISEERLKKSISEESQIDKLLLKFYHEVYRLDFVLNNPSLPESKLLSPSKAVLDKYEDTVEGIDNAVKMLKQISDSIFDFEELNEYSRRLELVEMNVENLWMER